MAKRTKSLLPIKKDLKFKITDLKKDPKFA